MTKIRVTRDSVVLIDTPIPEELARKLSLMAWAFPQHLRNFHAHASKLVDIFRIAVLEALASVPACADQWNQLCQGDSSEVSVDVVGLDGTTGRPSESDHGGGSGGHGAWPGGGGGGGGGGREVGGPGGAGADGALIAIQWSDDGTIIDVQTFVTPGTHTWFKRPGVDRVWVAAFGAGGGGGGGASGGSA